MDMKNSKDKLFTSYDHLLKKTVDEYLNDLDDNSLPSIYEIRDGLILKLRSVIRNENSVRVTSDKIRQIQILPNYAIAKCLVKLNKMAVINLAGKDDKTDSELYIYRPIGKKAGLYDADRDYIRNKIREWSLSITRHGIDEVLLIIRDEVPVLHRSEDPDLIILENGIFNYKTKDLASFDPQKVFITKPNVAYPKNPPKNPVIYNEEDCSTWDVESWMLEIAGDDPELAHAFWEHIAAVLRPNVNWNKSIWYYSMTGNSGKGTLLQLMRNLLGKGAYASISLSEMGESFGLSELIRVQAILTDENDVGMFIDKAANLKAIITGDALQLNLKYQNPITFMFKGLVVQCLNEMPRFKDKTDSFYRRQLFVPFKKSFTGCEKKYIKKDYLKRKDVLEYVLYKVMNTDFYELSEPTVCGEAFEEYKLINDPVRQFAEEILPECRWDLLPFTFLYELYRGWSMQEGLSKTVRKTNFIDSLLNIIKDSTMWECKDKRKRIRTGANMNDPEHLIAKYNITSWMSPCYQGSYIAPGCIPDLLSHYCGLVRIGANPYSTDEKENERER